MRLKAKLLQHRIRDQLTSVLNPPLLSLPLFLLWTRAEKEKNRASASDISAPPVWLIISGISKYSAPFEVFSQCGSRLMAVPRLMLPWGENEAL